MVIVVSGVNNSTDLLALGINKMAGGNKVSRPQVDFDIKKNFFIFPVIFGFIALAAPGLSGMIIFWVFLWFRS